jgi:hypothetical protein
VDEGVASSQEKSWLYGRLQFAKNLASQNSYIKFDKLFQIYELGDVQPQVFYSQSASIIVFLIRPYGKESFLELCRKLRDGLTWQQALISVYRFENIEAMESAWKTFMLNK